MEQEKAPLPVWLQPLLASKFFEQCEGHSSEKRNEENLFCMDCACRLCANCLNEHTSDGGAHNLLQIRHYVHSDVVRVSDVIKLLDIAKIQQYVANSAKVVHLNPKSSRPYPEGVPKSYIGGTPCITCARAIAKPNLFCSIACKIAEPERERVLGNDAIGESGDGSNQAESGAKYCFPDKEGSSSTSFFESGPKENWAQADEINAARACISSYRKRSRKGIPMKSPSR